jgi:hypothetical protein
LESFKPLPRRALCKDLAAIIEGKIGMTQAIFQTIQQGRFSRSREAIEVNDNWLWTLNPRRIGGYEIVVIMVIKT